MATVKSLANTDPALVPKKALENGAVWMPRAGVLLLIVLSLFGNYVQFNDGWERAWTLDERTVYAILGAIGWQTVCSFWQWWTIAKYGFWSLQYQIPLQLSAVPSMITYYAVIVPRTERWTPGPELVGTILGYVLTGILCLLFDTMVERTIVKRT